MRVLLDTHAFLWAALKSSELSHRLRTIIAEESNAILVSAASAWEIATKVRLGKLALANALEKDLLTIAQDAGYLFLPIDVEDALRAGRLAAEHRDPFDRMIAAQAIARDIPVISNDARLDAFGVRRIW